MIYYVTNSRFLDLNYELPYRLISIEESLNLLHQLKVVGLDTETSGLKVHEDTLLSLQLGCYDFQIVIDCTTINILNYKEFLESDRLFIIHNAKFDLQWLYKYKIVPKRVYDLFLAERIIWLGYPIVLKPETWDRIKEPRYDFDGTKYILYMNLKKLGELYLGIELDKTIRGQIIYKGLTDDVIIYAANDVKYLEQIMECQKKTLKERGLLTAVDYENRAILPISYMIFCGIKIDKNKWKAKMENDLKKFNSLKEKLDDWLIENEPDSKYVYIDIQGDLFNGFDTKPKVKINWQSGKQVLPILQKYNVDTSVLDKETKEEKNSIDAKLLAPQADKCSLIPIYLEFKEMQKLCSTYGENVLKQINKDTGRLYTNYNPIGTDTARISSGGKDKSAKIEYINMLNMPADAETRACFVAEPGNKWISIDYSGQESVIMADVADDKEMINELMYGEGDLHTLTAKIVFPEIPKGMKAKQVKKEFHELRGLAKGYEFAFNYGGNESTIMKNFGLSIDRAKEIYNSYMKGFDGLKRYQEFRRKDWRNKGYIELNSKVGYKAYIYDYKYIKSIEKSFNEPNFWDYYKDMKNTDPNSHTVKKVKDYFKRISESDRHSINYPIQHTGALCYKVSMINFFEYLRKRNLLFKVLITVTPYDEINCEAPEEIAEEIATDLYNIMVKAGAYFCTKCKLDADISRLDDGSLPNYWIH